MTTRSRRGEPGGRPGMGRMAGTAVLAALAAAAVLAPSVLTGPRAAGPPPAEEEPDYPHGDWSGDCTDCHSSEGWRPVVISPSFRHAPDRFPLRGAHKTAPCRACHQSLEFPLASTECVDCHRDAHLAEFGSDCSRCHTPTNFIDRSRQLAQHRATRFPLTGTHVSLDCDSCHPSQPQGHMVFVNTPTGCVDCHLDDYQATTSPDHQAAGFSTDCQLCHRPTSWQQAGIDHDSTGFPLTGAHRSVDCQSCHTGGYAGTPTDCYSCHRNDYESVPDPDHPGSGFPTDCTYCHNTNSFEGGSFTQHDSLYFPIYSGRHNGRWSACSDCHTTPSNPAEFTCFLCHSEQETTSHHSEVSGYSYDSQRCYACHPRGRAQ